MAVNTLAIQALRNAVIGVIALAALIFLPAGTLDYWQAWVFIVVFTAATSAIGIYLALKDPALLERRIKAGPTAETRTSQRIISALAFLGLLGVMVFCAVDHRFMWSHVPLYVSVAGDVLVSLGLFIDLLVLKENTYGASTIQVIEGQHVISTGPYAIVRHPMYAGALVMMVGIPLALGSWWGFVVLVLTMPVLVLRILDEEKLLTQDLPGYTEYMRQVRYRLVPFVW